VEKISHKGTKNTKKVYRNKRIISIKMKAGIYQPVQQRKEILTQRTQG
jgi:hypothetical protein